MMSISSPNRTMPALLMCLLLLSFGQAKSQSFRNLPHKYPSLLWEISGKGMSKPSYLFGTMHVSDKMVFRLPDSFYLALKSVQVVSLETNPGTWQEDQKKYQDLPQNYIPHMTDESIDEPSGQITEQSFQLGDFNESLEGMMEYHSQMMNQYLYRSNGRRSDFEEDTYLDLHIYQVGRKLNKTIVGLENFARSMELMQEAYMDQAMANEQNSSRRYYGEEEGVSLEDAYRNGNLDLLDTLNILASGSKAFSEKFIYKRNEIQANSIDSLLRRGTTVFAGVGAAHLPGNRGVIEMLRAMGYTLRPVMMNDRNNNYRESFSRIRVPVSFNSFRSPDGSFSLQAPGKLYESAARGGIQVQEFADMSNGGYYSAITIPTYAQFLGMSSDEVWKKIDSMLYEHTPGKIISRKMITKDGWKVLEVYNKTRRGDVQASRYYVLPSQIMMFRVSGTGDYIQQGPEAAKFFNSISLQTATGPASTWTPAKGGFKMQWPGTPAVIDEDRTWSYAEPAGNAYLVQLRTPLNLEYLESDSVDLYLMHESFLSSKDIDTVLNEKMFQFKGIPAFDVTYRTKNKKLIQARYLIMANSYYSLAASGVSLNDKMTAFLNSFEPAPFIYEQPVVRVDSQLYYRALAIKDFRPSMTKAWQDYAEYLSNTKRGSDLFERDLVLIPGTGQFVTITRSRPSIYAIDTTTGFYIDSYDLKALDSSMYLHRKVEKQLPGGSYLEYEIRKTNSSRALLTREYHVNGSKYFISARLDTNSLIHRYEQDFFNSFEVLNTLPRVDRTSSKTALLLKDIASRDSTTHANALTSLDQHNLTEADLPAFQHIIDTLSWSERDYIGHKAYVIYHLSQLKLPKVSDYLAGLYAKANDTIQIQRTILEALQRQETSYSYNKLADIMLNDPPAMMNDDNDYDESSSLSGLADSVALAKAILPKLLPLMNVKYYDEEMMGLMTRLSDSSALEGKMYQDYLPKLIADARMEWKMQVIREKTKGIQKATEGESEARSYTRRYYSGYGSDESFSVINYVKLLLPWYRSNASVHQLMDQMLTTQNENLLMQLVTERLNYDYPVADSILYKLALSENTRSSLYDALSVRKGYKVMWTDSVSWARSALRSQLEPTDSIVYLGSRGLSPQGQIYFFKVRGKSDENWVVAAHVLGEQSGYFENYISFSTRNNLLALEKFDPDKAVEPMLDKLKRKVQLLRTRSGQGFYSDSETYSSRFSSRF